MPYEKSRSNLGIVVACALITCCLDVRALAADAKAQITELEHKCTSAPTAEACFACFEDSNELVVYDLTQPREFDGGKAAYEDFRQVYQAFRNPKFEFIKFARDRGWQPPGSGKRPAYDRHR